MAKSFESICVHEVPYEITTRPHSMPMILTSAFQFDNIEDGIAAFRGEQEADMYSRLGNPTVRAVEKKLALLEAHGLDVEVDALLFGSGIGAISTLFLATLNKGDKVLTQANIYGGTTEALTQLFDPLGIHPVFTDLKNTEYIEDLLKRDSSIKMIYCESPTNPTLQCIDLEELAGIAHRYGRKIAIDSTFCTPYLQQPLKYGFDYVIHSTTKFLNGHSNSITGVLIGHDVEYLQKHIKKIRKLVGTICSPFDAWILNIGLKTLALRMEKHCANAQKIATFLEDHNAVQKVNYPGLPSHPDHALSQKQMRLNGGMLSFELKDGFEAGKRFMNNIQFAKLAPTLGDVDTLVMHPASMSHINIPREVRINNGITDGLIRLSVGIEDAADIIEDLGKAV